MIIKPSVVYHKEIYFEYNRSVFFRKDVSPFETLRGAWKGWELYFQINLFYGQ